MSETTTLQVRVGKAKQTQDEAHERIKAIERGEEVEERHVLNLATEDELARLISVTNLAILRAIATHEPQSMREVAELVERDFKEVHRNLKELETMGVIELVKEGRSKRPVVRFDELEIEISMRHDGNRDIAIA